MSFALRLAPTSLRLFLMLVVAASVTATRPQLAVAHNGAAGTGSVAAAHAAETPTSAFTVREGHKRPPGAASEDSASKVSGALIAFWIFGALVIAGALATITAQNPVTAALFLVFTLFCTGGLYLTLHATFIAAIQVLVYAGAIMVLFMFVVMVFSGATVKPRPMRGLIAKVLGVCAVLFVLERLLRVIVHSEIRAPSAIPQDFGTVRHAGQLFFSRYLFPFEAVSLLLLVAIVGAVMVSRRFAGQKRSQGAGGVSGRATRGHLVRTASWSDASVASRSGEQ